MAGYQPTYVKAYETGLVQSRQNFILPNDAFPVLENAYVWRERIRRKQGSQLLGRLRRVYDDTSLGVSGASPWSFNLFSTVSPAITETNAEIEAGSVFITIDPSFITGTIIGYNNTTNCEVFCSAPHGLVQGDSVSISGVVIVPGSGEEFINGGPYIISVPTATSFTINRNSKNPPWAIYQSGGTWTHVIAAGQELIDQGNGTLATSPVSGTTGTINYISGAITITGGSAGAATVADFNYFPSLPVMGLRSRQLNAINNEMTVAFDQKYAYRFANGWKEFIPGTTWTGNDSDFFWSTNYWVSPPPDNNKLFWVTNFSANDPIRYTDGQTWTDFAPRISNGDPLQLLIKCLCIIPFRGRLVVFNTYEGHAGAGVNYAQRIRWAAIGNPIPNGAYQPWFSDVRGQGGFLDIPTAENIVSVGFVRDNVVVFCESSTWQLRYTGRSISPFTIERVNSELGAESTFSSVQFDTSLVGIGDKGVVECDSFKSNRIDIKIPDIVFQFNNEDDGPKRVHGIRDFYNRLAYWTFPYKPDSIGTDDLSSSTSKFPNKRLCYNYENDSWSIFTDSLTCLGNYQQQNSRRWNDQPSPSWESANFSWINRPALFPLIVGGNQQGYVMILQAQVSNGTSLTIQGIVGQQPLADQITSVNHNLNTGQIIEITGIPAGTAFATSLNGHVFGVVRKDKDRFEIYKYNSESQLYDIPQIDPPVTPPNIYVGGGQIIVRDNFIIRSKKFNFLDQGQTIQFGYCDILMNTETDGAFSMNVYQEYADDETTNTLPKNKDPVTGIPDAFFNTIVPMNSNGISSSSKTWTRVFCATRASFITLEYTFSNAQMSGDQQQKDVQIDAQVLYMRPAGTQLPWGF